MVKMIICEKCNQEKPHRAKGLCSSCYQKQLKPKMIICENCGENKLHVGWGLCERCYTEFRRYESDKKESCLILKQHHKKTKDNPDALKVSFMQEIIGIKCE